jgi:hypothetical protein
LNVEGAANDAAGTAALEALATAPYDFPVTAARMAMASLRWAQGRQDEARSLMRAALEDWQVRQTVTKPASPLEKDIAEIRTLVFQPMGGAIYRDARLNGFAWPSTPPPFFVVNPDIAVKSADGTSTRLSLSQPFPEHPNVLRLSSDEAEMLSEMMRRLGGTKTREGRVFVDRGVMEAPVVPTGPSVGLIEFLATFFEARPGHWGGWEFHTYPNVTRIEFLDPDRTKARAAVTIGYAGADVLLERIDGAWKAIRLVNQWVT